MVRSRCRCSPPHVRAASEAVRPEEKLKHTMQRADIINAVAAGAEPYAKNGSFILRTLGAGGYVGRTLVGPGGPTALGQLWAETTGRQLPERGFRMDQRTIHHGASEFSQWLSGPNVGK